MRDDADRDRWADLLDRVSAGQAISKTACHVGLWRQEARPVYAKGGALRLDPRLPLACSSSRRWDSHYRSLGMMAGMTCRPCLR